MKYFQRNIRLTVFAAVLSIFTLIAFHFPFFSYVVANVTGGFNSFAIVTSLIVMMLALNFFIYYLVLYLGRIVGKCILSFTFLANSVSLYFINSYEVLINNKMMGNVFNTRYSEASGFFSWSMLVYILILGVIPCIYIFIMHVDYGKWKSFFRNAGISLGIVLALALANMSNWPWIDRHASIMGSLLMPWSYTINTIRWYNGERERNKQEIPLPDATIGTDSKDVCVLIIGESARRANFSLYGYPRHTNPLLEGDNVAALIAESAATYTTAGVKAILDHKETGKLYEILPNYLHRTGAEVEWRTSNWGEPPVHIDKYLTMGDLKELYPDADDRYDGMLLEGLGGTIRNSPSDKTLIVIHTSTSHGPTYFKKYPAEFEKFTPVCTTVEMSKADPAELTNAYDNTILYTDNLLHSVIDTLRTIPDRRSCMIFVSDHGESLGEGNLYMHGVPMSIAPKVQTEIPFIVWTSDSTLTVDTSSPASQYHVFHSILHFLGIDSPVYNSDFDIFTQTERRQ